MTIRISKQEIEDERGFRAEAVAGILERFKEFNATSNNSISMHIGGGAFGVRAVLKITRTKTYRPYDSTPEEIADHNGQIELEYSVYGGSEVYSLFYENYIRFFRMNYKDPSDPRMNKTLIELGKLKAGLDDEEQSRFDSHQAWLDVFLTQRLVDDSEDWKWYDREDMITSDDIADHAESCVTYNFEK